MCGQSSSRIFLIIGLTIFIAFGSRLTVVETATDYNRYLAKVFQKYGSGDTMSFEGLEHLMYNLGLGGIEFEPQHTIDEHRASLEGNDDIKRNGIGVGTTETIAETATGAPPLRNDGNGNGNDSPDIMMKDAGSSSSAKHGFILEFREMHDPKHRHPREKANFDVTPPTTSLPENVCLSPQDVLRLVVNHEDLHKRKLYRTVKAGTTTSTASRTGETSSPDNIYSENFNTAAADHNTEAEYIDFINNVHLTPLAFMKLCPALLVQIDQQVCKRPAPLRHVEDTNEELWNAWIYASCSIFILSACGLLGIALVPLMQTVAYKEILKFLVAVAVGTLSGDALMHLLPHALVQDHSDDHASHSGGHGHDNTPVWICACAFATAVFMYILEHLLPLLRGQNGTHGHSHGKSVDNQQSPPPAHHHHHHTHHREDSKHSAQTPKAIEKDTTISMETETPASTPANQLEQQHRQEAIADLKEIKELNIMLNETKLDMKAPKASPLTPVAFMVIIGDGLHNLTDGLAIGAAFATDPVTGLATAFAVLCHELPHELGDFALLLQTGVSIRRAVYLNIVSSVLSFLGMAIGLLIAGLHSNMTQWIYAGTAGSFLYIAFADLIPAMGEEDGKNNLKNVLIQIAGIIVGGVIMVIIAVNEERLEELFQ